jgi:hypothetical protein
MARATASDVASDLAKHETQCAERWKTAFNRFDSIDTNIASITDQMDKQSSEIKSWLIGTIAFLATSLVSVVITMVTVWG